MPRDLLLWANGTPRVDLDLSYPPFVEVGLELLSACRKRGADYFPTSATRWWAEQGALHELYLAGKGGRAAPPGYSGHQFGLAWDLTRDANLNRRGLQPSWKREEYTVLTEEAERLGLHSGASYDDCPHVSWPGYVTGEDLAPLRAVWLATEGDDRAKLEAVWRYVDGANVGVCA